MGFYLWCLWFSLAFRAEPGNGERCIQHQTAFKQAFLPNILRKWALCDHAASGGVCVCLMAFEFTGQFQPDLAKGWRSQRGICSYKLGESRWQGKEWESPCEHLTEGGGQAHLPLNTRDSHGERRWGKIGSQTSGKWACVSSAYCGCALWNPRIDLLYLLHCASSRNSVELDHRIAFWPTPPWEDAGCFEGAKILWGAYKFPNPKLGKNGFHVRFPREPSGTAKLYPRLSIIWSIFSPCFAASRETQPSITGEHMAF